MRTPGRFRAEKKYVESTDRKANVNQPIMALVGDGGGVAGVPNRANWYHIRLVADDNRLTQCRSLIPLGDDDIIYVAKAKDRKLSFYEFVAFIEDGAGGLVPPVQVHDLLGAGHGDTTAAAPVRGNVITGQGVAPLWTRLPALTAGAVLIGDGVDIISDITPTLTGLLTLNAGALLAGGVLDVDGIADAIVLDADGDTTISAPIDDQIDVEVGGVNVALFDADGIDVQTLQLYDTTELTIAAGVITVTQSYHRIDTQGDAATDDLDTINGGVTGDVLVIRAENDARTVVVKHATGNIDLVDGTDITLDDTEDHLTLIYDGAVWCDVKGRQIIANGVTKTVGAAGDFTIVQDAIDWFKNKLVVGTCIIDELDSASYNEAVVFEDIFIAKAGSLVLRGDTRVLAGISYVDGALANQAGLANGGSGTCALANAGNNITVTGTAGNPDFDADGWGAGDKILVYDNAGATAEFILAGALNNVITLTVAAPAVGNDATAICLKPDRVLQQMATVDSVRGVLFDGWSFEPTATRTLIVNNGGYALMENCLGWPTVATFHGFRAEGQYSALLAADGACSVWECRRGWWAYRAAQIVCTYAWAVGCSQNPFRAQDFAYMQAAFAVAANTVGDSFAARVFSFVQATGATSRLHTVDGYYAADGSFMQATSTDANNSVPGVGNYNPAPGAIPGYGNGNGNADLYAS